MDGCEGKKRAQKKEIENEKSSDWLGETTWINHQNKKRVWSGL